MYNNGNGIFDIINDMYVKHSEKMKNYAKKILYNKDNYEVIVHDVFEVALNKKEKFKKNDAAAERWLFSTLYLKCFKDNMKTLKQSGILPFYEEILKVNSIDISNCKDIIDNITQISDEDVEKISKIVLSRLNKNDKFLYKKIYKEKVSKKNLAMKLGISVDTMYVQIHRLRERIIEQVRDIVDTVGYS